MRLASRPLQLKLSVSGMSLCYPARKASFMAIFARLHTRIPALYTWSADVKGMVSIPTDNEGITGGTVFGGTAAKFAWAS